MMRNADQTNQARGRAEVRELRSPVSGWKTVALLLLVRQIKRRLREQMTSEEALEQAKALARRVRDEAAQRDVAHPQGRYPAAIQPSTERQSSIPR